MIKLTEIENASPSQEPAQAPLQKIGSDFFQDNLCLHCDVWECGQKIHFIETEQEGAAEPFPIGTFNVQISILGTLFDFLTQVQLRNDLMRDLLIKLSFHWKFQNP